MLVLSFGVLWLGGKEEGERGGTYTTLGTTINLRRVARVVEHTPFVVVSATNTIPLATILSSSKMRGSLLHIDSWLILSVFLDTSRSNLYISN